MNRLFSLLILASLKLNLYAQQRTSFVNFQYYIAQVEGTQYQNQQQVILRGKNFPVGLQQVINTSNFNAWRIGVTFLKQNLCGNLSTTTSGSQNVKEYRMYHVFSPSFQLGHEFQLRLYRLNMLYSGLEMAGGMMHNTFSNEVEQRDNSSVSYRNTMYGYHWNIHGSASVFAGLRFHVGACILGFESSLANRYTSILSEKIVHFEPWMLQHRISIGYIRGYQKIKTGLTLGCSW